MKIAVAGISTEVGKTFASAVLVKALQADYWKPVQSGNLDCCDTSRVKSLVVDPSPCCHPEAYRFRHPYSPHYAAALDQQTIDPVKLIPPLTSRPLVIECAGGLLAPFTNDCLQIDLFSQWSCRWVLVSKHYLGSINHTLLALEALCKRNCPLLGIVFTGQENPASEQVILKHANCPMIGRLSHQHITPNTIARYASQWNL